MRLRAADLRCRQPSEFEAEPPLEFVGEAQLIEIVAGQGDNDCALVAVRDRSPGSSFELARKLGPPTPTLKSQRKKYHLARLGFDRGGEHAGRRPAGAAPGFSAIINRHRATCLR